jgi:hypothetical protein
MAGSAAQKKAREDVRRAQADFEREREQLREQRAKSRRKRRERFAKAQKAGLSLREIGEAADLHLTRVREILRED